MFLLLKLTVVVGFAVVNGESPTNHSCSMEMFDNVTSAYFACRTQYALQSNWFPSPIAGLFSYLIWNGFDGFWQNGAVLEPMVNFMEYGNNTRYKTVIQNSYRSLYSLLEAYGPYPSFDDMGWYGLSYARIYEIFGGSDFLQSAIDIFNWSWTTGWDQSGNCSGGFFFDNLKNAKQTITNVELFQLGAKLFHLTHKIEILHKLNKIYNYIFENNIVNRTTFQVVDGIFMENCSSNGVYGPTYNAGVLVGGLVELYKSTKTSSFLSLAIKIADSVILRSSNSSVVLTEFCDPKCDEDAIMFKGIFVRNLRYLMDVIPDKTKRDKYQSWMDGNVRAIVQLDMCDEIPIQKCNITFQDGPPYYNISGPVFSPNWNGPFTVGAPMQQTSALDLFVSAIPPGTKCKGEFCSYDPPYPAPQPLTCGSKPCPQDMQCCEYSPYTSYTCCASGQKCKNGICV